MSDQNNQRKAKHHREMFVKLSQMIHKESTEYAQFEIMASVYVMDGDLAKCRNIMDLLRQLENKGKLGIGQYEFLKETLTSITHAPALKLVEMTEKAIANINDCPCSDSLAGKSVPELAQETEKEQSILHKDDGTFRAQSPAQARKAEISFHSAETGDWKGPLEDAQVEQQSCTAEEPRGASGVQKRVRAAVLPSKAKNMAKKLELLHHKFRVWIAEEMLHDKHIYKSFKQMCRAFVRKDVLEHCEDAHDVLGALEDVGCLGIGKHDVLKEIFQHFETYYEALIKHEQDIKEVVETGDTVVQRDYTRFQLTESRRARIRLKCSAKKIPLGTVEALRDPQLLKCLWQILSSQPDLIVKDTEDGSIVFILELSSLGGFLSLWIKYLDRSLVNTMTRMCQGIVPGIKLLLKLEMAEEDICEVLSTLEGGEKIEQSLKSILEHIKLGNFMQLQRIIPELIRQMEYTDQPGDKSLFPTISARTVSNRLPEPFTPDDSSYNQAKSEKDLKRRNMSWSTLTGISKRQSEYIRDQDRIDGLVSAMTAHPDDSDVQYSTCKTLADLVFKNPDVRRYIDIHDVVELIISSMEKHMNRVSVQVVGLSALVALFSSMAGEIIASFVERDGIEKLISTIVRNTAASAVQELGLELFALMCTSAKARRCIQEKGGVELVIAAMNTHNDSTGVQTAGVGTIIALLNSVPDIRSNIKLRRVLLKALLSVHHTTGRLDRRGYDLLATIPYSSLIRSLDEPPIPVLQPVTPRLDIATYENDTMLHVDILRSTIVNWPQIPFAGIYILTRLLMMIVHRDVPDVRKYIFDSGCANKVMLAMERMESSWKVQTAGSLALAYLVQTFPGRHSFIHKSLEGVKHTLSAMQNHQDVILVQSAACFSFYCFSQIIAGINKYICDNGGVDQVLLAMGRHERVSQIQSYGCMALFSVSKHIPSIQEYIRDKGGVDIVLFAMDRHGSDTLVQTRGCEALAYLGQEVEDIQKYIHDKGGIDRVLSAMERHTSERRVQSNGCKALAFIGRGVEDIQRYIHDKGGIEKVLAAMERHVSNSSVQANGCIALASLYQEVEDIQRYIHDKGGIERVLSAMERHDDDSQVQGAGCLALAYLGQNIEDIQRYIQDKGGIERVLSAMERHDEDSQVQGAGCLALAYLGQNVEDIQRYIHDKGGIERVLSAMERHDSDDCVQSGGCTALAYIGHDVGDIQSYICDKGGIERVLGAMGRHGSPDSVQARGCEALANLGQGVEDIQRCITDKGGLERVLSAMERYGSDRMASGEGSEAVTRSGVCVDKKSVFWKKKPPKKTKRYRKEASRKRMRERASTKEMLPHFSRIILHNI